VTADALGPHLCKSAKVGHPPCPTHAGEWLAHLGEHLSVEPRVPHSSGFGDRWAEIDHRLSRPLRIDSWCD